ncbi:MAG: GFA family protein [Proteobacteria bacterium]|nr:GFA family protein [Pseudomonadota bacterium]
MAQGPAMTTHRGGCHCGSVQFEIDAPAAIEASDCNCSICRMCGFLHLIVPRKNFRLLQGDDVLTAYTFNTGIAQHFFCKHCGIKSFYVPRSHPDAYSVNVHCLDSSTIESIAVTPFDGRNWEQNVSELSPIND